MKTQFLKYIESKGYSLNSLRSYGIVLEQFEGFMRKNGLSLKSVEFGDIDKFLAQFSPRTAQQKFSAVNRYYRWLKRQGVVEKNPVEDVEYPSAQSPLPTWLEMYELDQIRTEINLDQSWEGVRDRAILELLFNTGIRNSELRNATLDDTDLDARTLKFMAKGGTERILPLNMDAVSHLQAWLNIRGEYEDRHLFLKKTGTWFKHIQELNRIIHKRTTCVGKTIRPHDFRHSLAMELLRRRESLPTIQRVLGHKGLGTVQVYVRARDEDVGRALNGIATRRQ